MKYFLAFSFSLLLTAARAQSAQPQSAQAQSARAQSAEAQSAEDSVKAAVNQLFTAMKSSDPSLLRSAFADSAILQTIVALKDKPVSAHSEPVQDFAELVGKRPKGDLDERIRFDVIRIDGPLAIVWAPYTFYLKGSKHHCGVDSFQLLRINGVWKIQYLIDTRRPGPCDDL